MKKHAPPKVRKYPAAKQRRLDQLLDKNSQGTITAIERETLAQLVADAERLMVENAKRLAEFSKSEPIAASSGAVPVTIWVQPQSHHVEP
jgi:hypothetical protein